MYFPKRLLLTTALAPIIATAFPAMAQRTININPGYGTLNTAIEEDYNSNGAEVVNNTIYLLKRDQIYYTTATIENVAYTLNVFAEEGDGARPIIKAGVDQGGLSVNSFTPRGDLHLKGLNIRNVDVLGNVLTDCVVGRSDSLKITFDDCHFDSTAVAFIRMDVDWLNIKAINCLFSNAMGTYHVSRLYDTRKNNVDSILIQNCTLYNIGGYPSRGTSSGGAINSIIWDHNTLYNVGRKIGGVGQTIETHFTNNLFINTAILGRDSTGAFFPPEGMFEDDWFLTIRELNNIYAIGKTQKFYFHHNNFYNDDAYVNYPFPEGVSYPIPYFEPYGWQRYHENNSKDTWFTEPIAFTNPPPVYLTYVDNLWTDTDTNQDGNLGDEILAIFSNEGKPFDFSYPTDHVLYTAGSDGFPLGDLNWFPEKKAEWEGGVNSITRNKDLTLTGFELMQNYPNPFNAGTIIAYRLSTAGEVDLSVINTLGQKVVDLVSEKQAAGNYQVRWEAKNFASGIYFIRLVVDGHLGIKKMLLVK